MKNRTVAFIDVLGFKEKIKNFSADELGKEYKRVLFYALEKYNLNIDFFKEISFFKDVDRYCEYYVFSDSIILTSFDDTINSSFKLLIFTFKLARTMIAQGYSIRGAITFGEMFVDLQNSIFVGEALVKAYQLEYKQNWIGIVIDDSVIEQFPSIFNFNYSLYPQYLKYLFVKYEVPFKEGKIIENFVINWRFNLIVEEGIKSLFPNANKEWSAKIKIDNTLQFSKYIKNNNLAYPIEKNCPLEIRTFYVGTNKPAFKNGDEL